jgi:hypothetical protein
LRHKVGPEGGRFDLDIPVEIPVVKEPSEETGTGATKA